MSDSDDPKPKPRKPQPKPRSRRMVKPSLDSVRSPAYAAPAAPAAPQPTTTSSQARRRLDDDFFSKAKNYREVFKSQETAFQEEAWTAEIDVAAPEILPTEDETLIPDFEDEQEGTKEAVRPKNVQVEHKRKREPSLTPPPETPTRRNVFHSIPLRTVPTTNIINLEGEVDNVLEDEAEPELDPELASIAAKIISTPLSPGSSQPMPLSQPSSQPSLSESSTLQLPTNGSAIPDTHSTGAALASTSTSPGSDLSSPAMLMSPPLSASSLRSSPATVDILLRMMRHPLLVIAPEYALAWAKVFEDIKVTVKADAHFREMMTWYCGKKNVQLPSMIFTFRQSRLMPSSTPRSLDFPPQAVVDVYDSTTYKYMKEQEVQRFRALESQAEKAEEAAAIEASLKKHQALIQQRMAQKAGEGEGEGQGERAEDQGDVDQGDVEEEVEYLYIKLRGKDTADEKIRVKKTTTVLAIIKHYKAIKKLAAETPVKLEFDDETIDPNMIIGDTEVEDDDMLIVWVG